jgi:methionine sulfoxide reductase heme-binding subunit
MTSQVAAALGPSAYWYLARATGVVSLVLLTASVVLGVLGPLRFTVPGRWPRFAIDTLHRDVSLLVVAVLVIHIVTSVLDGFAPINLLDAVIPFRAAYRPLWMGLGAFAFDFLLALVVTSVVRRRLGYRAWRAVHWLAYASWPVAVLHGLGTGSDTRAWWNLALTAVCLLVVLAAVWARIKVASPLYGGFRQAAIALSVATPIGLAIFALAGPLQSGWARRAGTPVSLLTHTSTTPARSLPATSTAHTPSSFSAQLSGSVQQTAVDQGAIVQLAMRLSGGASGRLRVRIGGQPVGGGGLSMTGSQVDLVTGSSLFQGQITALQGQQFTARVQSAQGSKLRLDVDLQIDQAGKTVSGSLQAQPAGAS